MNSWMDEPVGTVEPDRRLGAGDLVVRVARHARDAEAGLLQRVVACDTVSWMTFGTVVVGGPVDTFTATADP